MSCCIITYDTIILFLDYAGNFNANFNADGQRHYVRYGTRPVRHHDQVSHIVNICYSVIYYWHYIRCSVLLIINLLSLMVWRQCR